MNIAPLELTPVVLDPTTTVPYVLAPLWKVFAVEVVSVMFIVELAPLNVKPVVVVKSQTVPDPVNVTVLLFSVTDLVVVPDELNAPHVNEKLEAEVVNVPAVTVRVLVDPSVNALPSVTVAAGAFIVKLPLSCPPLLVIVEAAVTLIL